MNRAIPAHLLLTVLWLAGCDGDTPAMTPSSSVTSEGVSMERITFGISEEFAMWPLLPSRSLEFKAWRGFTGMQSVDALGQKLSFLFPSEFVDMCKEHNGGVLSGLLVFNAPDCKGLAVSQFLGFGDPTPELRAFNDDVILTAIEANSVFIKGSLSTFVPFARVSGSIANMEKDTPWGTNCFLSFQKSDSAVYLVSPSRGVSVRVAKDFASFMQSAAFLRMD